jgi:hypothetical protein
VITFGAVITSRFDVDRVVGFIDEHDFVRVVFVEILESGYDVFAIDVHAIEDCYAVVSVVLTEVSDWVDFREYHCCELVLLSCWLYPVGRRWLVYGCISMSGMGAIAFRA